MGYALYVFVNIDALGVEAAIAEAVHYIVVEPLDVDTPAVSRWTDTIGKPFDWLYIDADTLREKAARYGYAVEVVAEGDHYDYLARITKRQARRVQDSL